jgi:hypothetical protein
VVITWTSCYDGPVGALRGILLMRNHRVVEKIDAQVGHFSVTCKFQNVLDQKEWAFSGVYGSNADRDRLAVWEELAGVAS